MTRRASNILWTVVTVLVLLSAGVLLTGWLMLRTDRLMRDDLLRQTTMVAQALDIEHIQALTGTTADLGSPAYGSLKTQFTAICSANPLCRYAYLFGRRDDDTLVILVDDVSPDSDDYVAPGAVYEEASEALRQAFNTGNGFVEGPVTDRWGTWISAMVPIHDPQTHAVLAVLGMDINANTWRHEILTHAALPTGILLALLTLLFLTLLLIRSHKELRKINERYRILFSDSPDAYLIFSSGLIQDCNKTAETLLHGTREQIVGSRPEDISPAFQLDGRPSSIAAKARIADASRAGTQVFEWVLRRLDGSEFMAEMSISAMTMEVHRVMFVTFRDITMRKQAEEALRESEERFSIAFMSSPAPLVLSEIDTGLFVDVNDRWVTMLGFSRHDQIGKTSKEVGIWDDPSERDRIVTKIHTEGGFWDEPINFRTKTGDIINVLWSGVPVNLSKKPIMLSLITDITARKRAEEERERLQSQLMQAQKMESVGRLAGGVAHDFNNMLGVILGYTGMALSKISPSEPTHAYLEEVQKAAQRSANLTRQLLAFARRQTIAPKILDLNETVESMLKILERLIGEDIELHWKPTSGLDPILIDPAQIDQLLANLLVNARDAIGQTGGLVTIETGYARFDEAYCVDHRGFTPGTFIMLVVSDNGCGMDATTQELIFEPFFTTKGVGEGTGLGLATVYGIVKQNNGFINVYSEPGQGTTFRIYLPVHQSHQDGLAGVEAPEAPLPRGNETILLVEDEPSILIMTHSMLDQMGYCVLAAARPGEAIRMAEEHPETIHLLITDVVMPEMNGRDLAEQLKPCYPSLKFLFMSGYTADVIAHQGVLNEGVNFIQKPFSIQELGRKIREALNA